MKHHQAGYSLLETTLCLAIIASLLLPMAGVVRSYDRFYLDWEVIRLVQFLRYMEKKAMNTNQHEAGLLKRSEPELRFDFSGNRYTLSSTGTLADGVYTLRRGIWLSNNIGTISFNREGRPRNAGYIWLHLPQGGGKKIIIDVVGRIRIERVNENG